MPKILHFKFLTDGDSGCDKSVRVTDEEFESLRPCRGFPDEIDVAGGLGHPAAPDWTNGAIDRKKVKGEPDAVILVY